MAKKIGIIKAPDGFYIGSLNKTGLPSADARRITDDEITFMFEDMMRRNKVETGKGVKTFFHKHIPVMIAKIDPSFEECGIMTPQMQAMLQAKAKQQAMTKAQRQPKGLKLAVPR